MACRAVILAYAIMLAKLLIAFTVLIAGGGCVMRSGNNFDLCVNTLAASFLLEIDNQFYLLARAEDPTGDLLSQPSP